VFARGRHLWLTGKDMEGDGCEYMLLF